MSSQLAFATPTALRGYRRWLLSPAARIGYFIALMALTSLILSPLAMLLQSWPSDSLARDLLQLLNRALVPLVAYLLLVRLIERRRPDELAWRRLLPQGAAGLAAGFVLFSMIVGAMALAGSYHLDGFQRQVDWSRSLLVFGLGAGIGEEIITRGVLYRIVEEGLGTWWALAISALFFGAAHIFNPGATVWSSLAIAIEAGILLALLYLVTRSLWTCVGLHAAWNVMQGTVFGIPVSGTAAHGWLVSERSGPDWLSGGVFGAEASVVALITCTAISALLLVIALRQGRILPPSWRRRPALAHT